MTKLLTITAIFFAAILMITETDTASAVTKKKPHYVCPTCNYVSDKPGQCPMDKKDLV